MSYGVQSGDLILVLTVCTSFFIVGLIFLIVWLGRRTSLAEVSETAAPKRGVPLAVRKPADPRPAKSKLTRRKVNKRADLEEEEEFVPPVEQDEDEEQYDEESSKKAALRDSEGKKIGKKKMAKLEEKEARRRQREIELQEREERKERERIAEERRRQEEEAQKAEELKKEEEERRIQEEKRRQEEEEYQRMKAEFQVEEAGFEQDEDPTESQNRLQAFINYIQEQKVVLLEDLAGHFKLRTQEAINRVQALLEEETLVGVIDDRGKFIHIKREELEAVAKFIRQRGRVSINELVESSNTLINLQPES